MDFLPEMSPRKLPVNNSEGNGIVHIKVLLSNAAIASKL
jgi:hypothetical protein